MAAAIAAAAAAVLQPAAPPPPVAPPQLHPPVLAALNSLGSADEEELVEGHLSTPFSSRDDLEEVRARHVGAGPPGCRLHPGPPDHNSSPPVAALLQMVHEAFEQEIENINQAVHAAFEQERADFDLQVGQTVQDAVQEVRRGSFCTAAGGQVGFGLDSLRVRVDCRAAPCSLMLRLAAELHLPPVHAYRPWGLRWSLLWKRRWRMRCSTARSTSAPT